MTTETAMAPAGPARGGRGGALLAAAGVAVGIGLGWVLFRAPTPFQQSGMIEVRGGTEGTVHFPVPYASAPNVTLSKTPDNWTDVVDSTSAAFRWRNANAHMESRTWHVAWQASGVR